ncbi:hypothetical protein ACN47E_006484 [Coniothyrium glycines]
MRYSQYLTVLVSLANASPITSFAIPDLATVLSQHAKLSTLNSLLKQFDLFDAITSFKNITIIAPTDQAYLDLANWGFNVSEIPAPIARALLEYHIIDGTYISESIPDNDLEPEVVHTYLKPPTLTNVSTGAALKLSREASGRVTTISGLGVQGGVEEADVLFNGGVLHTLNASMVLPHNISITAMLNGLTTFLTLMDTAGVVEEFESAKDVTVFIPTNRALAKVSVLMKMLPQQQLATILRSHIVANDVVYGKQLGQATTLVTIGGTRLSVHSDKEGHIQVGNADVVREDIILYGGVAHVVDDVLLPEVDTDLSWQYSYGHQDLLAGSHQRQPLPI